MDFNVSFVLSKLKILFFKCFFTTKMILFFFTHVPYLFILISFKSHCFLLALFKDRIIIIDATIVKN
jgi:hypothetical protein